MRGGEGLDLLAQLLQPPGERGQLVEAAARRASHLRRHLGGVRLLMAAIPAVTAVLFGGAFWLNTRADAFDRPRRRAVLLLVLQTVIAALSVAEG